MATKITKKAAILLLWLAVWQALSLIVSHELIIPSPLNTLKALLSLAETNEFYLSVAFSLLRIVCGFALGVITGFLCGILSYKSHLFKEITAPIVQLVKAVPVASFIILAFFWFKSTTLPIFIAFLMVLPIIWSSTETALSGIDRKYIEMGQVFRLTRVQIFFKIQLPLIFPTFISSALTALGFAWKSGVAAEVIAKPLNSLGGMLEQSKTHLEIAEVFALTAVVAMLSLLLEVTLKKLFGRYSSC